MTRARKSIIWVLTGMVIGILALTILGGHAMAQESSPQTDAVISGVSIGSAHFGLDWNVNGTGGGTISSTHFTVSSTIGQPTVGTSDSTHFEVCSGYWCWLDRIANIFLPLVLKN
jgi:hypothetical protein